MSRSLPSASAAHAPLRGATGSARPAPARSKTIPFDYQFELPLTGEPGHRAQDVVAISVEGPFVAVALGYSVVPDGTSPARSFEPATDPAAVQEPVITTLVVELPYPVPETIYLPDSTLEPQLRVVGTPGADVAVVEINSLEVTTATLGADGSALVSPPEIQRSASQVDPILQVIDLTHGIAGGLLAFRITSNTQAFWTPTVAGDPEGRSRPHAREDGSATFYCFGAPDHPVTPYVIRRSGQAESLGENGALELDVEQADLPDGLVTWRTAPIDLPSLEPGDTLGVRLADESFHLASSFTVPRPRPSTLTLGSLAAGLARAGADLTRGFRLAPGATDLVTADPPLDELGDRQLAGAFLTGCSGAEDASFLYSIDTVGSGRELQNAPIHNLAGLGIADGDRPFRPFARPVVFEPRSSIRFQVEELSGPPGTLYVVLQGYKVLGAARPVR